MKKILFILILLNLKVQAQTTHAVVCDSVSKQPLPSASIKVKGTRLGTITNVDGRFSMAVKQGVLQISYIGYKTKEIAVNALPDTVFLAESNLLNEVIVMPDSALKILLRNAYNNISKNYPQKPTYLTGFYREIYQNINKNTFNYFSENFLKIYKPAYTPEGREHAGQIKVLKSRTIKHPDYAQKGTKYAGGPSLPIAADRVLKRQGAINPVNFKSYYFDLEKVTNYDGQVVYVINCTAKDSTSTTKLYISKSDLAYIKIEVFNKSESKNADYKRKGTNTTMIYDKKDNDWYLKYISFRIDGENKDEEIGHSVEFVTTNFETENIETFSYDDQFLPTEIIADQKNDVSNNFFEGQEGIIEQSNDLQNQIKLAFNLNTIDSLRSTTADVSLPQETVKYQQKNKKGFADILLRANVFIPGLGLGYTPIQVFDANFTATISNTFKNDWSVNTQTRKSAVPVLLSQYYTFSLTKRWFLQYSKSEVIRNSIGIYQKDLGIAYRFVLNKATKPIYIEPNLKYTNGLVGVDFGEYKNPDRDAMIDDKKMSAKKLDVGIYRRNVGLKLGVNTTVYSLRRFLIFKVPSKIYLMLNYQHIFSSSEPFLRIKEERFFNFLQKTATLPINDSRLKVPQNTGNLLPKISDNFWIGLSYRVALR